MLPPQRVFELLYTEKPLTDRDPTRLVTFRVTAHNQYYLTLTCTL